jgi:glycosyltransferase involved in cell wall biosynthesis
LAVGDGPRILVFDLTGDLHLPSYLRFLMESWCERDPDGVLNLFVHPEFLRKHGDVVALAKRAPRGNVRFLTLNEDERRRRREGERAALERAESNPVRSLADVIRGTAATEALSYDWQLLHRYARKVRATQSLIAHFDWYLPLLACAAQLPCPLSGIFFAPTFHYRRFGCPPQSEQERAIELHQKFLFARTLRREQFYRLYLLDPFAVEETSRFPGSEKVTFLPDPVPPNRATETQVSALRTRLAVEPGRSILLMFGHLTPRKGCDQILEALMRLPESVCRGICLVFAGVIESDYRSEIEQRAAALCAERPIQLVTRFEFVAQQDVASYFRMADVVLTPYPKHPGKSGLVLLAAAAGTPVLSSRYGLMAEYVRRHRLGLTVDATDSEEIAAGLKQLLTAPPVDLVDFSAMKRLAEQHHATRFGATLLDSLLSQ